MPVRSFTGGAAVAGNEPGGASWSRMSAPHHCLAQGINGFSESSATMRRFQNSMLDNIRIVFVGNTEFRQLFGQLCRRHHSRQSMTWQKAILRQS